jgi:hypothetical protein
VDAGAVAEYTRSVPLTPVPLTPPALVGLLNLRGEVVPLFDLRAFLKAPDEETPPEEKGPLPDDQRAERRRGRQAEQLRLVLRHGNDLLAFGVDRVDLSIPREPSSEFDPWWVDPARNPAAANSVADQDGEATDASDSSAETPPSADETPSVSPISQDPDDPLFSTLEFLEFKDLEDGRRLWTIELGKLASTLEDHLNSLSALQLIYRSSTTDGPSY